MTHRLLLTGSSKYSGAFLIDPVDNTPDSPESASSPSACKALKKSGRAVSIIGAGITGPCNPAGSNFEVGFPSPCHWTLAFRISIRVCDVRLR